MFVNFQLNLLLIVQVGLFCQSVPKFPLLSVVVLYELKKRYFFLVTVDSKKETKFP